MSDTRKNLTTEKVNESPKTNTPLSQEFILNKLLGGSSTQTKTTLPPIAKKVVASQSQELPSTTETKMNINAQESFSQSEEKLVPPNAPKLTSLNDPRLKDEEKIKFILPNDYSFLLPRRASTTTLIPRVSTFVLDGNEDLTVEQTTQNLDGSGDVNVEQTTQNENSRSLISIDSSYIEQENFKTPTP